jgi:hypothetical protein
MANEYGCGQIMLDGGKCTSAGEMPCLCDVCQLKIIRELEAAQQSVQSDVATHCACGLSLLPDGTCPMHFQYTTQRR